MTTPQRRKARTALVVALAAPLVQCGPKPPLTAYDPRPTPDGEGVTLRGHLPADAPDPVPLLLRVREQENCSGSGEPGFHASIQCLAFGVVFVRLEGRDAVVLCSRQDDHGCKALFEELTGIALLPGRVPAGPGVDPAPARFGGAHPRLRGCLLVAEDGTPLGSFGDRDDPESVCNPFGHRGSRYATDGPWNPYGRHGGTYSPTGALNQHASSPPKILCGGAVTGRLTRNRYLPGAIDPSDACPGRTE